MLQQLIISFVTLSFVKTSSRTL